MDAWTSNRPGTTTTAKMPTKFVTPVQIPCAQWL
jgi:hypothetical protein